MKMPKRFTDTELWEKEWFLKLEPRLKCLVKYVRDKCDIAGIWKPNYILASFCIGKEVTQEDLLSIDEGRQFQLMPDDKILCIDFVTFQYGSELNPSSPIHRKILNLLSKYDISYSVKEVQAKGFNKPSVEEIKEEMLNKLDEFNATIQANKFFDYYESVGWNVGKNKMKSWRHAVSGWISRARIQAPVESITDRLSLIGNKKVSEL